MFIRINGYFLNEQIKFVVLKKHLFTTDISFNFSLPFVWVYLKLVIFFFFLNLRYLLFTEYFNNKFQSRFNLKIFKAFGFRRVGATSKVCLPIHECQKFYPLCLKINL